jgi:hypothetical protein
VAGVGDVLAEFADADLADKFGAAAAEHAATWSWADSARRLETMLAEVAEESGRSRA